MSVRCFNKVGAIREKAPKKVKVGAVAQTSYKIYPPVRQLRSASNEQPAMKVNNADQFKGDLMFVGETRSRSHQLNLLVHNGDGLVD